MQMIKVLIIISLPLLVGAIIGMLFETDPFPITMMGFIVALLAMDFMDSNRKK